MEAPNDRESRNPDYYDHRNLDPYDDSGASDGQYHEDYDGNGSGWYGQGHDPVEGDEKNDNAGK